MFWTFLSIRQNFLFQKFNSFYALLRLWIESKGKFRPLWASDLRLKIVFLSPSLFSHFLFTSTCFKILNIFISMKHEKSHREATIFPIKLMMPSICYFFSRQQACWSLYKYFCVSKCIGCYCHICIHYGKLL